MHARPSLQRRLPLLLLMALAMAFVGPAGRASAAATADLGITLVANSAVVPPGGATTFTVVITNDGPHKARGITVSDPFGKAWNGVTCIAHDGGVCRPYRNGYLVTFDALASGESATITFVAHVGNVASGFSATNTVSVGAGTTDPNAANDGATASVQVQ